MKFENNWRYKSLESLEKDVWPKPDFNSHLVTRASQLRKIPLNEFSTEDLRIMIGQSIGLAYLIPIAIETLKENVLADGDFYEGDLLQAVVKSDTEFWRMNPEYKSEVQKIITDNLDLITEHKLKVNHFL